MRERKKIKVLILVCCLLINLCTARSVMAKEISGRKNALDVMFVLDISGSMKWNDPNRIALEVVKAFTDTVGTTDVRIGFVAYNDEIAAASSPVTVAEQSEREQLKQLIDATPYTGNTDIGLGLLHAYELMPEEEGRDRVIVLVSDGESDLKGSTTGRTLEQSNQDLDRVVQSCSEKEVPIYTIAFGDYSGNKGVLEDISARTGASTYMAKSPELLIEVLYGILNNSLAYKIQQFSVGRYSAGTQEIHCVLDKSYLSEINVLLISPQRIGNTAIQYDGKQIPITVMNYYAVGKVTGSAVSETVRELTVSTDTTDGQQIKVYVIGYRNLEPILNLDTEVTKKQAIPYQVYFKDMDGNQIINEAFYREFEWNLEDASQNDDQNVLQTVAIEDGFFQGELEFGMSGNYELEGVLADSLGSYRFSAKITAQNTLPSGSLPKITPNIFSKDIIWDLDEFFTDIDGDLLQYTLEEGPEAKAGMVLEDNKLIIKPMKSGQQSAVLLISDGEDVVPYEFSMVVIPLWQAYWQVVLILIAILGFILWKLLYKPEKELEEILQVSPENRFNGRLDAYFTKLPQNAGEIPPLVFQLYKMKENKFCLGDLLNDYADEVEKMGLDQIYMVADEERKILLYHATESSVMIGNSIACRELKYKLGFGDVIYITSADGKYEMELRYIAVIQ